MFCLITKCVFVFKFQKQSPEVFKKKGVLKNFAKFTEKLLCQSLFLNKVSATLLKKRIEFCEIFKNTYFIEQLKMTVSNVSCVKKLIAPAVMKLKYQ